ncbi:MAG: hypothetical protein WD030_04355 [Pirellulales bacterium]
MQLRQFLQFRLRTLLVFVCLVAFACIAYPHIARNWAKERLIKQGWRVTFTGNQVELYDKHADTLPVLSAILPLGKVTSLEVRGQTIDQPFVESLRQFKFLRSLKLSGCCIQCQEFSALHGLASLEELEISHVEIQAGSLRSLYAHPSLRSLTIFVSQSDPRSLQVDRRVFDFPVMPQLTMLAVIGNEDLGTLITEDTIAPILERASNIESLTITYVNVDDDLLSALIALPLKSLDIRGTQITWAACHNLLARRPHLRIEFNGRMPLPEVAPEPEYELEIFEWP